MLVRRKERAANLHSVIARLIVFCGILLFPALSVSGQTKNSCLDCHAKLDAPLGVTPEEYQGSIHAQKGITCVSCHGGDATKDDMLESMDVKAGFRGHIERSRIPSLCGKCHADAAYMRGYDPSLRTDQFSQYQTSVHGKLLAKGDTHVAVCADCHGAHGIHAPNDPRSSVYPTNVAQTCARCHADEAYMKLYKIPTTQSADYKASVHHQALADGDLSAPTCSTCHGSHGAAPPGVDSIQHVCSTCHLFQSQLFDSGPHKDVFAAMGLPGCITCHSNHGILAPTDAMIGTDKSAVCAKCHSEGEPAYATAAAVHRELVSLDNAIKRSDEILQRAGDAGIEVGEAQLALADGRDDLTKARVAIHSVQAAAVDQDIQAGLKVAQSTYQTGVQAMAELRFRREGLVVSLAAIGLVIFGLAFLIREIESKQKSDKEIMK